MDAEGRPAPAIRSKTHADAAHGLARESGDRRLNENEPRPPRGVPNPPSWFSELEIEAWNLLAPSLEAIGVLAIADGPALQMLCQAWAEWRVARQIVEEQGSYYIHEPESGPVSIRKHPAVGVASDAWRRVSSMLSEFGLTPSARSRLEVAAPADPDSFEKFLGRGRSSGKTPPKKART